MGDNTRSSAPALPRAMPFPCCLDSCLKPRQEHCVLLPGGLEAAPPQGSSPPIAFPLRAASSPGVIPGQHRASRRFCSSSAEFTPRSGSVVALAAPAAPERLNFSKLSPHPPLQGWTLAEGQGPPPLRSTALGHTDSSSQGRERRKSSSTVGKGRGRRTRSPFGLRRARRCLQQCVTSS